MLISFRRLSECIARSCSSFWRLSSSLYALSLPGSISLMRCWMAWYIDSICSSICAVSISRCLRCVRTQSKSAPAWRFFSLMWFAICCTSSGSVEVRVCSIIAASTTIHSNVRVTYLIGHINLPYQGQDYNLPILLLRFSLSLIRLSYRCSRFTYSELSLRCCSISSLRRIVSLLIWVIFFRKHVLLYIFRNSSTKLEEAAASRFIMSTCIYFKSLPSTSKILDLEACPRSLET